MNGPQKRIVVGVAIFLFSVVVGFGGTALSIHKSFDSLKFNETPGIGAVGGWIYAALFATILGLIGSVIGVVLVIAGIMKGRKLE